MKGSSKRVAIVHDWLVTYRGGERVLEAICEQYPGADIYTLFYEPGTVGPIIERHRIRTSFLERLPKWRTHYRHYLPLFPLAIERFDLSGYDLVISSSHCVAKGVIPPPDALHVSYCHTPMRYAWDRYHEYFAHQRWEPLMYPFLHYLRGWDVASSARVDHFVANSAWVAKRIQKYYRREADVVTPFVDIDVFQARPPTQVGYYLFLGAGAPYKRADLAIAACRALKRKLVVVGDEKTNKALKRLAGEETRFFSRLSLHELVDLYSGSRALLFPGEEDFGIAPLESMACGRPVIALARGGALETVVDGVTGILYPPSDLADLKDAIQAFEADEKSFDPAACRKHAELFSKQRFVEKWLAAVENQSSISVSRDRARSTDGVGSVETTNRSTRSHTRSGESDVRHTSP